MQNGNSGKYYYYAYNNQGDVVALIDGSTFVYAAEYTYDSWGKLISVTGDTTIGNLNPFRYRGYYYDTEIGLYYLNARYYNPEIGRFLNADSKLNIDLHILGCNLFTYCKNNPIINYDPNGTCWHRLWIFGDCDECKKAKAVSALQEAVFIVTGIKSFKLPDGWKVSIHSGNTNTNTKKHVHIEKGGEKYSQNVDGSPHDGSTGAPPKSVLKKVKKQTGWDWEEKAKSWGNQQNSTIIHCCTEEDQRNGTCKCKSYYTTYPPSVGPIFGGGPMIPTPVPVPSPFVPVPV